MVNGHARVYVEREGRIESTPVEFSSDARRSRGDRAHPCADRPPGRRALADGRCPARGRIAGERRGPAARGRRTSHLDPPLRGRSSRPRRARGVRIPVTARRGGSWRRRYAAGARCWSPAARARARRRSSTRSPPGSTPAERVITIEDAAELRLRQPHVVRLESRPASVEGRGEVTIRDLLRNALRMRPDRIVIGEVRGAGGARPPHRPQHRPRRRPLDPSCELARGRASPARDPGAHGGRGPSSRRDPRAGRPRRRRDRPCPARARRERGG